VLQREWNPSPPFVELAIFDSSDALLIARTIDAFCLERLGARVARGIFHPSSIGSVTGVELEDERRGRCRFKCGHFVAGSRSSCRNFISSLSLIGNL
jgi:hypothetical protein